MLDATLVMDNPHIRRSRIHGRQRIAVLPDGIVVRLGIVEGDWEIAEGNVNDNARVLRAPPFLRGFFMPRCGATTDENVGGALRAAIFLQ